MAKETLAGVELSHLDQPVFDDAGVTKGDLVRYLDGVHQRILPELRDRALSVVRARLGQAAFMGISAYTCALLVMKLSIPWPVAAIAGVLASAAVGAVVAPVQRDRLGEIAASRHQG